jgi:hypothetical protein
MADILFKSSKQRMLTAQMNWASGSIVAVLVNANDYQVSENHATLLDVPPAARVAVSGTLRNCTATDGVADADDLVIDGFNGNQVDAVMLVEKGTTDGTSYLITYLDQGHNIPFIPNGNPITLQWSNGNYKIFAI